MLPRGGFLPLDRSHILGDQSSRCGSSCTPTSQGLWHNCKMFVLLYVFSFRFLELSKKLSYLLQLSKIANNTILLLISIILQFRALHL